MSILIRRSDFPRLYDSLTLLGEMREAFRQRGGAYEVARASVAALDVRSVTAGTLPSIPAFTVRTEVSGEGRACALVALHALASGELLALIDGERLCALRDAVVGALAVEVLAREDAERVALVGAGPYAGLTLKCLRLTRSLRQLRVYDSNLVRSHELATRLHQELSLPARAALTVEEAVSDAQLVVTTAPADAPTFFPGTLVQGCHLNALGLGERHRRELAESFLRQSSVFCDDASSSALPRSAADGRVVELQQVLRREAKGRADDEEVTVFVSAGAPFEDLVVAWHLYLGAKDTLLAPRVSFSE